MPKVKFIDLFAGIGGIRLGFEQACIDFGYNTECVFTSEIDDWACQTYRKNFPNDGHDPKSDVTKPKGFKLCGNEGQRYHQVGNSVSCCIVNELVKRLQDLGVLAGKRKRNKTTC